MKPGTPCIIEPIDVAPTEVIVAQQLAGLMVVTRVEMSPGLWDVSPPARITVSILTITLRGTIILPNVPAEVLVHQSWLRPLNGPSAATPAAEPIDVESCAHG